MYTTDGKLISGGQLSDYAEMSHRLGYVGEPVRCLLTKVTMSLIVSRNVGRARTDHLKSQIL